jgi:hypothetical protein
MLNVCMYRLLASARRPMRVRYREVATWPIEALTWQLQIPELTATVVDDTHGRDMPLLRTRYLLHSLYYTLEHLVYLAVQT